MSQAAGGPVSQVLSSIEIRGGEAIWVLAAHLYAILVPLILVLVTNHHWDYLQSTTHNPSLFYIAAVLMAAGSAFEVAQNTIDQWYLTPEVASANGVGFCDMLAFWFMCAGQAVLAVGLAGDAWWVLPLAVLLVVAYPICYLTQTAHFLPPSLIGVLVAILCYQAFGDPFIFLSVFLGFTTIYFFMALLKTGAQLLHGFTTIAASSGLWFFRAAVENGEAGTPVSWGFLAIVIAATVALMGIAWPVLTKLPTSPRIVRQAT